MTPTEKRAHRKAGEDGLAEKLRLWRPAAIVVVLMGVTPNVRAAMAQADTQSVMFFELPFPRRDFGRYERYVDGLSEILIQLEREGVLDVSRIPKD